MIVNEGLIGLLKKFLLDPSYDVQARLFQAGPGSIDSATVLSDLTECDFPGYAPIGSIIFPTPTINVGEEAESDSPTLTWTRSSSGLVQDVLGIYVTFLDLATSERLLFAEYFVVPVSLDTAGQTVIRNVNAFLIDY